MLVYKCFSMIKVTFPAEMPWYAYNYRSLPEFSWGQFQFPDMRVFETRNFRVQTFFFTMTTFSCFSPYVIPLLSEHSNKICCCLCPSKEFSSFSFVILFFLVVTKQFPWTFFPSFSLLLLLPCVDWLIEGAPAPWTNFALPPGDTIRSTSVWAFASKFVKSFPRFNFIGV